MNENKPQSERHLSIPLSALHAINETRRHFSSGDSSRIDAVTSGVDIELTDYEKTPEGFIELGWEHLETQTTLHQQLLSDCSGPLETWPKAMQHRAQEAVAKINKDRVDPMDVNGIDRAFLLRITEPRWTVEATNSTQEVWPEDYMIELDYLAELEGKLTMLSSDEELRQVALEIWDERSEVMRTAVKYMKAQDEIDNTVSQISALRIQASQPGKRRLSPARQRRIRQLEENLAGLETKRYVTEIAEELMPKLFAEIERRMRRNYKKQLDRGLLMTDTMNRIIQECLGSAIAGKPILLVGETGGAKTALAKYIAKELLGKEPEIVSGYADVNGYQLMGSNGLVADKETGVTYSEFIAGPVVRAMEEGRPLILDEINAMPPEFLKRLNEITQLRPGQTTTIQEDSGRQVTVAQGFCIIATTNEKSKRYKGVHDLSTEFRNRFTANTYRVPYPDSDVVVGQEPTGNICLAHAVACDSTGNLLLPEDVIERFAKAAHLTQKLYSGSIADGLEQEALDYLDSDRLADRHATGLDENVIAPRTMADLIEKVIDSNGALMLAQILDTWLGSIKSPHDKRTIEQVLDSHHLLPKKNSNKSTL